MGYALGSATHKKVKSGRLSVTRDRRSAQSPCGKHDLRPSRCPFRLPVRRQYGATARKARERPTRERHPRPLDAGPVRPRTRVRLDADLVNLSSRMSHDDSDVPPRKQADVFERRGPVDEERDVRVEVLPVQHFVDAHVQRVLDDGSVGDLTAKQRRRRFQKEKGEENLVSPQ